MKRSSLRFIISHIIGLLVLPTLVLAQPANDECTNAIRLNNLDDWCSATSAYTNVGATNPGNLATGTCWSGTGTHDVWFVFTATATDVRATVKGNSVGGGSLTQPEVELYTSTDCINYNIFPCGNSTGGVDTASSYKGGYLSEPTTTSGLMVHQTRGPFSCV